MIYQNYYQTGGDLHSGVGRVYIGKTFQRGAGVGSFLGGVFRYVLPLLKRGALTVGREALNTGLNIATDITNGKSDLKKSSKVATT